MLKQKAYWWNVAIFFPPNQWRSNGRASGGTRPGAQVLGAHQHTFCSHSKTHLKQKFSKVCLKMRIFMEKSEQVASASGAPPPNPRLPPAAVVSAPRPLRCFSRQLLLQLCRVCF